MSFTCSLSKQDDFQVKTQPLCVVYLKHQLNGNLLLSWPLLAQSKGLKTGQEAELPWLDRLLFVTCVPVSNSHLYLTLAARYGWMAPWNGLVWCLRVRAGSGCICDYLPWLTCQNGCFSVHWSFFTLFCSWNFFKSGPAQWFFQFSWELFLYFHSFVIVSRYCWQICNKIFKYDWNVYIFLTKELYNQEYLLSITSNILPQENLLSIYVFLYVCVNMIYSANFCKMLPDWKTSCVFLEVKLCFSLRFWYVLEA